MVDANEGERLAPGGPRHSFSSPATVAQRIWGLLVWDDVVTSLIAFSCGILFVLLVKLGGFSALTILAYVNLLQLVVCFVYVNGIRFYLQVKNQLPNQEDEEGEGQDYVTREAVLSYLEAIYKVVNVIVHIAFKIIRCKDNALTLKFIGVLFLLSLLGRFLDDISLFGILYTWAFTFPKVYQIYQPQIDAKFAVVNNYLSPLFQTFLSKLPQQQKNKPE